MKTKRFFFLSLFLLSILQISEAQEADFSKTSQLLDSLEKHNKYMGTILLAENGQIKFAKSLGYADTENSIKNIIETRYRIGSISKMFTSVLIFKSIEEGKLSLETPLADFFPDIPKSNQITIDHLLKHRSGIHSFTNDKDYLGYNTEQKSREDMLQLIVGGGSDFEPDSKGEYSNSNYVLLSYILEDIHRKSFAEILDRGIVKPLKLKNTVIFDEIDTKQKEAKSYTYNGGWVLEKETHPSIPMGAGAIQSTAEDLVLFAEGLFGGKLISEHSLTQMQEIQEGYGRGMFSFPYYDKKSLGHTGGIDGFRSMLGYFPEEKVAIVTLSNGLNWNNNDVLLATLNGYFGKEVQIPSFLSYEVTSEMLDQYLGEYVSEQIPISFTFVKEGNTLIAKPSGQPDTNLEATAEHQFEFTAVGAVFIFDPEKGLLTFKQGGGTFQYQKK
ncbi:CubicO group peptidase, beta-lactamase class C family [Algoriphagus faecimaris]|uniref:CubicO group peptidase, beta-lactamase class C family n=1 Tax=Algoriphagus faecimaris TaxID=686796 RepID=A0A1G6XUM6_9BACT|nr:serine hydrolase domain-containing protein [Algoriphagus faecimaris]SDD81889.1 CubicO group peptidase, beta-lactamase class C family [Algoriphagus faecimaris]